MVECTYLGASLYAVDREFCLIFYHFCTQHRLFTRFGFEFPSLAYINKLWPKILWLGPMAAVCADRLNVTDMLIFKIGQVDYIWILIINILYAQTV